MFQSTHPHGVRLAAKACPSFDVKFQSTHPHGVRRILSWQRREEMLVSIHAPTRGATCKITNKVFKNKVSIHAPTRGATLNGLLCRFCARFQSTHPHGVRLFNIIYHTHNRTFQSTHPHGVRLEVGKVIINKTSFNPRTHTGCD